MLKTGEMLNMLDMLDVWGEPPPPLEGKKFNIFNISRVSSLVLKKNGLTFPLFCEGRVTKHGEFFPKNA